MSCAELGAMMRKHYLQFKEDWKTPIMDLVITGVFGWILGNNIQGDLYVNQYFFGDDVENIFLSERTVIFILLFSPLCSQQNCLIMMTDMVWDKQSKMKETLNMIGLSRRINSLSYLLFRFIFAFF